MPHPSPEQVRDPIPTAVLRSQARGPPRPLPVCPSAALTLPGPRTRPRPRQMGGGWPHLEPTPPAPLRHLAAAAVLYTPWCKLIVSWDSALPIAVVSLRGPGVVSLPHALDTSGRTSTSVTVQRSNVQSGSRHHSPPFTETEISPLLIKLVLRCINRSRRGRTHGAFVYH